MLVRPFLISLVLAAAVPAAAHHSLAAEFDAAKPVVLHGTITKVAWMNPHVYFYMEAAGPDGQVSTWTLESVAPNYLQRLGLSKQSLKEGDIVTIRAFVAKDQPRLAKTDAITLPDGRQITTGHADDFSRVQK